MALLLRLTSWATLLAIKDHGVAAAEVEEEEVMAMTIHRHPTLLVLLRRQSQDHRHRLTLLQEHHARPTTRRGLLTADPVSGVVQQEVVLPVVPLAMGQATTWEVGAASGIVNARGPESANAKGSARGSINRPCSAQALRITAARLGLAAAVALRRMAVEVEAQAPRQHRAAAAMRALASVVHGGAEAPRRALDIRS